ncbi:nitric oxide synthase oxygenase [Amaricoccus solimangrovi]|uniref:Nitric oxide synthase oxygenase n=1 Tax=Amaricoccus solimangrovi TaxID=2589815 RepID=A0A501WEZ8_9RHOB|nr:nitric oxide synthase oxygenase [Amaricoccus solimangrovi]
MRRRLRRLGPLERREEAVAFVRRFHRENELGAKACRRREAEVRRALRRDGWYEHTPEELAFGARVAWRDHARCIGRLHWKSLEVRDLRAIEDPDEMAAFLLDHLADAHGGGRIRSIISIFAPVRGAETPCYVESEQLLRYAGYIDAEGRTIGDPLNIELTRTIAALGWEPPEVPGMFDMLPVLLRDRAGRRLVYEIPATARPEVRISHPDGPALDALGLRWYAVPVVSGMILTIGGIDYPCAPFNGYYMSTEIASRDLADENRYDLLEPVARALGEDTGAEPPLWKDRALLELNRAVLHSFSRDGVTMIDHHMASAQFMEFNQRERAAGRPPSAQWSWIVPPQASSACPVFHLPMTDHRMVPNFYRSGADDGAHLRPNHYEEHRHRYRQRLDRWKREIRDWNRAKT